MNNKIKFFLLGLLLVPFVVSDASDIVFEGIGVFGNTTVAAVEAGVSGTISNNSISVWGNETYITQYPGNLSLIYNHTTVANATIFDTYNTIWSLDTSGGEISNASLDATYLNLSGTNADQTINITPQDLWLDRIRVMNYITPQNEFLFNFYDDGSELFLNMSGAADAFNIETENSKLILFNEPNAANDFKVLQTFSKEATDTTEFVVTKAGTAHASYFVRSMTLPGNSTGVGTPFNCTTYAKFIDCRTDNTGPDLFVLDDIETNGSVYFAGGTFQVNDTAHTNLSGITATELINCDKVNTTADGIFQCATDQTGAGGSGGEISNASLFSWGNDTYVNVDGDTMTGNLTMDDINAINFRSTLSSIKSTSAGILDISSTILNFQGIVIQLTNPSLGNSVLSFVTKGGQGRNSTLSWLGDDNRWQVINNFLLATTSNLQLRAATQNISSPAANELKISSGNLITIQSPDVIFTDGLSSMNWTNVTITESQISDLAHTTDTDTNLSEGGTVHGDLNITQFIVFNHEFSNATYNTTCTVINGPTSRLNLC